MFNIIIYGERNHNKPHNSFMVGLMGCKSIIENQLGQKDGIKICGYTVNFEDGTSVDITNTIYAST